MSLTLFPFARLWSLFWITALSLAFTFAALPLHAQTADDAEPGDTEATEEEAPADSALWTLGGSVLPWSTTISAAGNSSDFRTSLDILTPFIVSPDGDSILFLNLEASAYDEGAQSYSAGLALRRYVDALRGILGLNVFYDHTETSNSNGFDGIGIGAEYKGPIFDINFNYVVPETDMERTGANVWAAPFATGNTILQGRFNQYEAALEGFYGEIGFLVPFPESFNTNAELRLFAGGYSFDDASFGTGGLSGVSARAELRLSDLLSLFVKYYEDEELIGGDDNFLAGFSASIPLGRTAKPFHIRSSGAADGPDEGDNPGSGAPLGNGREDVRYRMGEDVYRMSRLVTAESDATFAPGFVGNDLILGNVFFVNDPANPATGNGIGAFGDPGVVGTAESPAPSIEAATLFANAFSLGAGGTPGNVYAQGGTTYDPVGVITSTENINYVGSGKPIPAMGGFSFGEGPAPVIGPDAAFLFVGSGATGGGAASSWSMEGYTLNNDGALSIHTIGLVDVADAMVDDVVINNSGTATNGLNFFDTGLYPTSYNVNWTTINSANGLGAGLLLTTATGGATTVTTTDTTIDGFLNGIDYLGSGGGAFTGTHTDTIIRNTLDDAVLIGHTGTSSGDYTFTNTMIDTAGGSGIDFDALNTTGPIMATFDHLYVTDAVEEGFDLTALGATPVTIGMTNAMFTNVGQAAAAAGDRSGIQLATAGSSVLNFTAADVTVDMTGEHGIEISNTGLAPGGTSIVNLTDVDISNTGLVVPTEGDGLHIDANSGNPTQVTATDVTTTATGDSGLDILVADSANANIFTFTRFSATGAANHGIQIDATGAAPTFGTFTFTDTTVTGTTGGNGIDLGAAGTGDFNATFTNTTISGTTAGDGLSAVIAGNTGDPTATFDNLNISGSGGDGVDLEVLGFGAPTTANFTFTDLDITGSTGDGFFVGAYGAPGTQINATIAGTGNTIDTSGSEGINVNVADMATANVSATNVDITTTGVDGISLVTDPAGLAGETPTILFAGTNINISGVSDGVFAQIGSGADVGTGTFTFNNINVTSPTSNGFDLNELAGSTVTLTSGVNNTVTTPGALSLEVTTPNILSGNLILNGVNLVQPLILDTP